MRTLLVCLSTIIVVLSASVVNAQEVRINPAKVPNCLPDATRDELLKERSGLIDQLDAYNHKVDEFRAKCSLLRNDTSLYDACLKEWKYIQKTVKELKEIAADFKIKVDVAIEAAPNTVDFAGAADLVAAMNEASMQLQKLNRQPKGPIHEREIVGLNCQDFFRIVIHQLGMRRRKNNQEWNNLFPGMNADEIARTIPNDQSNFWEELHSYSGIQRRANCGALIVGLTPADPSKDRQHGHLVLVFPTPPDFNASAFGDKGKGPFVRDGNEHDLRKKKLGLAMSSWGAVKASRVTPIADTRWFLFVPSTY